MYSPCMSDVLPQYVPDFTYHVVRTHGYTNEELLDKNDEISLVMLLNKLQKAGDFEEFRKISYEVVDRILKGSPEDVVNLIAGIVGSMCRKLNVPEDEANEYIGRIRGERKMGYFFENMEKMDIQEERRLRKEAQDKAEEAQRIYIETLQELSLKREEIKNNLMSKFGFDREQAEEKMKLYWKES